jgi:hypothetical protein
MSANKIQTTKNYDLFTRSDLNRPLDMARHKKLFDSMRQYGFLRCFPVVVKRQGGRLLIKDGQHRWMIAQTLGLPVHWVEEDVDFDVATVNSAAKPWVLRDYAEMHFQNGHRAYGEGLEFSAQHKLPLGMAFSLLAGNTCFHNCQSQFFDGTFRVKDRAWADAVAGIYGPLTTMSPGLKNARFAEACMAVCRVEGFDGKRLVGNAERCREHLVPYATRDACLGMLELVYNHSRKTTIPLKFAAIAAMKARNAVEKKRQAKRDRGADAA